MIKFIVSGGLCLALLSGAVSAHADVTSPPVASAAETHTGQPFTNAEKQAFTEAFKDARRARLSDALAKVRIYDRPGLKDTLRWAAYRVKGGRLPFTEIRDFIAGHPDWPGLDLLRRRAEEAINADTANDAVLDWFNNNPPVTGKGMIRYAEVLMADGNSEPGTHFLKQGWVTANLTLAEERRILRSYPSILSLDDHRARINHFFWNRSRGPAVRLISRLPEEEQKLANARNALIAFAWDVDSRVAAVPPHLVADAGLVYDRVYWRRVKGKQDGARDLLLSTDIDGGAILRPDRWWRERHLSSRRSLKEKRYRDAYRLARDHKILEAAIADEAEDLPLRRRADFADAEWLAGWLALRFLDRPDAAFQHFRNVHEAVRYPVSLSRAAYWLGRSAEALGNPEEANRWYTEAARHAGYYYGQLAAEHLGLPAPPQPVITEPSDADRQLFLAKPLVRLTMDLATVRANHELRPFVAHLASTAATTLDQKLTAELGRTLDRPDIELMAAKAAARDGVTLDDHNYPMLVIPDDAKLAKNIILAITRQESAFDIQAVSAKGALGLMQLTPATAKRVARQISYPYNKAQLTRDGAYNMVLGSVHFAEVITDYRGSYILALAAYNAGPGPVGRWIRDYGDPRNPDIDPVDWVETIPYSETRDYIQRVLEGATAYARLMGKDDTPPSLNNLLRNGQHSR